MPNWTMWCRYFWYTEEFRHDILLSQFHGSRLLKKFPTFYGTRMFIIFFRRAHHLWVLSICFITLLSFYGEELLAPCPTSSLEDHPLSAVHNCLFNIFTATLHIWRPFLHPQPDDTPCLCDRDPLNMGCHSCCSQMAVIQPVCWLFLR
jgi:hypothetical protein